MHLEPDTEIYFGKHAGLTLEEIAEIDPSYIIWMDENLEGYSIDEQFVDSVRMDLMEEDGESYEEFRDGWT